MCHWPVFPARPPSAAVTSEPGPSLHTAAPVRQSHPERERENGKVYMRANLHAKNLTCITSAVVSASRLVMGRGSPFANGSRHGSASASRTARNLAASPGNSSTRSFSVGERGNNCWSSSLMVGLFFGRKTVFRVSRDSSTERRNTTTPNFRVASWNTLSLASVAAELLWCSSRASWCTFSRPRRANNSACRGSFSWK